MKASRIALVIALVALALLLLAYYAVNLTSASVWEVFRRTAPGLDTARTVALGAALVAALCLLLAGAVVAIPLALEPAPFSRRLLKVLPAWTLGVTAAALVANFVGLATLGTVLDANNPVRLSLAATLLIASAVLAIVIVGIAVARSPLSPRERQAATALAGVGFIAAAVLCGAMLAGGNMVQAAQAGAAAQGRGPEAGSGIAERVSQFVTGSQLMAGLGIIALVAVLLAVRGLRGAGMVAGGASTQSDYRREGLQALAAAGVITLIVLVLIQFVPLSRPPNPPVQAAFAWDSPQTQSLVGRACMNCHSNTTEWPFYATFAPGSWITAVHVTSARAQFNLSELTNLPAPRKVRLARDMVEQIRNGTMPPVDYLLLHPEAQLTTGEKEQLIQGLQNSLR